MSMSMYVYLCLSRHILFIYNLFKRLQHLHQAIFFAGIFKISSQNPGLGFELMITIYIL